MYRYKALRKLIAKFPRLKSLMAKGNNNKFIIPYFISMGFVAISINSISRGIKNHETWRIVTAGIGGSFFLVIAVLMIIRLIKSSKQNGLAGKKHQH
jgi:hypothetical protein